ncbi:MAG: hypothetical protein KC729_20520, partial [Candidatus Eisenbacteria bacterium]|nr:hypothetical protein [Candidatus Eisenbacteria bacterium]
MEHLAVVGLSWRQGGAHAIGQFTIPADEQPARLEQMRRDLHASGMVYLATCNRVEWIIDAEHGVELTSLRQKIFKEMTGRVPEPGEAERTFRSWVGEGAVEHLFLVTTGLESAKIGETDVQNQVRGALDRAREMDLLSPKLDLVLEEALQVARKVRRSTNLGRGDVSLAHIAEERIRRHVVDHPGTVVLLGVAKMTRRCGEALADADMPMLVVNRTLARAEELASTIGARACTLDVFRDQPEPVSVILSSTGSKEPVLSVDVLRRLFSLCPSGRGPLVIDLAIPPDVAPEDAVSVGIERIGMDE